MRLWIFTSHEIMSRRNSNSESGQRFAEGHTQGHPPVGPPRHSSAHPVPVPLYVAFRKHYHLRAQGDISSEPEPS